MISSYMWSLASFTIWIWTQQTDFLSISVQCSSLLIGCHLVVMEDVPSPRNILQRVGIAPDFASRRDSDSEEDLEGVKTPNSRAMNMKQESGAFLMPQLWKDAMNLNLDNITNDFLESNVTGEVMNLDDFLKELQVNELTQQTEEAQRNVVSPHVQGSSPALRTPGHHLQQQQQQQQHTTPNSISPLTPLTSRMTTT